MLAAEVKPHQAKVTQIMLIKTNWSDRKDTFYSDSMVQEAWGFTECHWPFKSGPLSVLNPSSKWVLPVSNDAFPSQVYYACFHWRDVIFWQFYRALGCRQRERGADWRALCARCPTAALMSLEWKAGEVDHNVLFQYAVLPTEAWVYIKDFVALAVLQHLQAVCTE